MLTDDTIKKSINRSIVNILKSAESDDVVQQRIKERERIELEQKRTLAQSLFEEVCSPLYRMESLVEAMHKNQDADKIRFVLNWRPHNEKSGLLIFSKESGTYKTTSMFQLMRRVIVEDLVKNVMFLEGQELSSSAASAYGDTKKTTKWLAEYKTARWLFIDDLFKGNLTPTMANAIFVIIEYRTKTLLPTVITTNATKQDLMKRAEEKDLGVVDAIGPLVRRIIGNKTGDGYFDKISFDKL